jgi:transcription elongation factor Elf1
VLYYDSMSLSTDSKYLRLISSRLRNFKQKDSYLWNFSCPICGDSQKNKSKARGYVFQKGTDLFYRCHNCGVSTNVGNLIKQVDSTLHKEYVLERYKSGKTNNPHRANTILNITPPKFDKVAKQRIFEHGEWVSNLPSGHFCLEFVTKRKIPSEYYDRLLFTSNYKKFCDALIPDHGKEIIDDSRLVIPFYDKYNDLIAVSGRALESSGVTLRYVTIRVDSSNTQKLVYGLERVDLNDVVKIVEGPIDSLFLKNCVASGDANLSLCAKNLPADKKVLIFDNEPRNKEIVKMMQDAIKFGHNVVIWPNHLVGKDINEMIMRGLSHDEIGDIISNNSFGGLKAQTKFVFWKKV